MLNIPIRTPENDLLYINVMHKARLRAALTEIMKLDPDREFKKLAERRFMDLTNEQGTAYG